MYLTIVLDLVDKIVNQNVNGEGGRFHLSKYKKTPAEPDRRKALGRISGTLVGYGRMWKEAAFALGRGGRDG